MIPPQLFTMTRRYRAPLWKIPFLILLRREWKRVDVYEDVVVKNIEIVKEADHTTIHYFFEVPPQAKRINICKSLVIDD